AGRVMRTEHGKTRVTDGPYSETKEVLGGYYTIEAANYDEAVQRTLDHPHLEHGGTIEVRQVYGTCPLPARPEACGNTCSGVKRVASSRTSRACWGPRIWILPKTPCRRRCCGPCK